jgi:hypothetical protein
MLLMDAGLGYPNLSSRTPLLSPSSGGVGCLWCPAQSLPKNCPLPMETSYPQDRPSPQRPCQPSDSNLFPPRRTPLKFSYIFKALKFMFSVCPILFFPHLMGSPKSIPYSIAWLQIFLRIYFTESRLLSQLRIAKLHCIINHPKA